MLLDTFAWIELWKGTEKGLKVKQIVQSTECFTSTISIAELAYFAECVGADRKKMNETVLRFSTLLEVNRDILEQGGVLKAQKRKTIADFGLVDAILLATSKQYNLPIVTGDPHFHGENTVML